MKGSGCKTCPVNPCPTMAYRGSTCANVRFQHGLGDPLTHFDRVHGMGEKDMAVALAEEVADRCFEVLALYGIHPSPADKDSVRYRLGHHYYHKLLEPVNEDKSVYKARLAQEEKAAMADMLRPTEHTIEEIEREFGRNKP